MLHCHTADAFFNPSELVTTHASKPKRCPTALQNGLAMSSCVRLKMKQITAILISSWENQPHVGDTGWT
eukprot:4315974-Amphidinium_carterae.1